MLSLVGLEPATTWLPLHLGTQLVLPPFAIVNEGLIPAGGVLTKSVSLPPVPPHLAFVQTFRQGFFFDAGGDGFLASGSALVTLAQE